MTPRARSLYALRQRISAGAPREELIADLDALITLDGPPDFDEIFAAALDRAQDLGIYPEPLQRAIAHALPRLRIATGWVRLEKERRYERRVAATGEPIAWVWTSSEWWEGDRHESDLGTWVYRVHMRGGATVERPCVSRHAAWVRADELLLQDEFGGPWVLSPSDCPICRGSGERTIPDPDTGTDLTRCDHCDGSGEILGGEG